MILDLFIYLFIAIVTDQPVNLKPLKVVAGHDPQKTNLFLQLLATAAKSKVIQYTAKFIQVKFQSYYYFLVHL